MHLLVHYLDLIRHGGAFSFAWYNWITNVSAGIFVFIVVDVAWQRKLKSVYERWVHRMHLKALAEHHEKVVKPLMQAHHDEAMAKADAHHTEHMKKLENHRRAITRQIQRSKE